MLGDIEADPGAVTTIMNISHCAAGHGGQLLFSLN